MNETLQASKEERKGRKRWEGTGAGQPPGASPSGRAINALLRQLGLKKKSEDVAVVLDQNSTGPTGGKNDVQKTE